MIGSAVVSVGKTVFFASGVTLDALVQPGMYVSLVICALALVLAFKKKHPILIICLSAVLGIAAGYLIPGIA
jgi:chromate transporter